MSLKAINDQARQWLTADPDATTQAELKALIESQDEQALQQRFSKRLEFGTAGLRGFRGAGPNRMNRLLVRMTTTALGKVLLERVDNASQRGVVIGFDARHLSKTMAQDACAVLTALGIRVHFLATEQPTPLAAFVLLELNAAAGIVLTASHNPPQYNGYKVFWDNGAQIIPPIDTAISSAIDAIDLSTPLPYLAIDVAQQQGLLQQYSSEFEQPYLQAILPFWNRGKHPASALKIVYTPLHGVGGSLAMRALQQQGFEHISVVERQARPDGNFPTVDFPNPEEPSALMMALNQARHEQADIVIANDPDGDRCAVIVRDGDDYHQLNGDQIGCLLADHILRCYGADLPKQGFVINTIVSSMLLGKIAQGYGVQCEQTLTGLKWVWNRALELEQAGGTFLFGYEEAIGYSVCPRVRDKDGISAAVLFAELARDCAAEGKTVADRLNQIYCQYGLASTRLLSIQLSAANSAVVDKIRQQAPSQLGQQQISAVLDYKHGIRTQLHNDQQTPILLPASNMIQFEILGGGRVSIRPSGTEPKLKIYLETYRPASSISDLTTAKSEAQARLDELEVAMQRLL